MAPEIISNRPGSTSRRRKWLLGAVLVAAPAVVLLLARERRRGEPENVSSVAEPSSPMVRLATPNLAEPSGDRLYQARNQAGAQAIGGASGDKPGEDARIQAFVDLLMAPDPESKQVAARARREFMEEPSLKQALEEFQRTPPQQRNAKEFVAKLGEMPEFRRLAAKFRGDPGTGTAPIPAAGDPLPPGLRHDSARVRVDPNVVLPASGQARAHAMASAHAAPAAGRKEALDQLSARGRIGLTAGGEGAPSIPAHAASAGTPAFGQPEDAGTSVSLPPQDIKDGHETSRASGASAGDAGKGAHNVKTTLDPVNPAGDPPEKAFCGLYPQFCSGNPLRVQPAFQSLVDDTSLIPTYGLWGACFHQHIYGKCLGSCTGQCRPMDGWSSCKDANGNDELTCIAECQKAPNQPCTIPDTILSQRCAVPQPPPQCAGAIAPAGTCMAQGVTGNSACAALGRACVSSDCRGGCSDFPAAPGPCGCTAQCR